MLNDLKTWYASGSPYIWLNAGAVSVSVLMVAGLIALIAVRGLGHFWPGQVSVFDYRENDGSTSHIIGEVMEAETVLKSHITNDPSAADGKNIIRRYLIKSGNRDMGGPDFRWMLKSAMGRQTFPRDLMVLERREWGNFYGFLQQLKPGDAMAAGRASTWDRLQSRLRKNQTIHDDIRHIEKDLIGGINYSMERLRLEKRRLELKGVSDRRPYTALSKQKQSLQARYNALTTRLGSLYQEFNRYAIEATTADGRKAHIPLARIVRAYRPNDMSPAQRFIFYVKKLWEFVSTDPREANTEGGVFPAIFGTVLMVMLMAVIVTPFGVIAAVYLHEYAQQGLLTRLIRIAVNNLAGVPSIVYGVFGLGFFVYFVGGSIDTLFFPEALPTPTFGTPGLLWAALTMALLTVPVVIVATEEGLSRVPRALREGSLALGATRAETLWRTVMPMTASAIMTGMILAVARAAGEVAPLMLVGVVKLAPTLPLDTNMPYLHLQRKFMHLGFHIYDTGFQSPNVEAARPLVYSTALLLVLIIITLNLAAIKIRNNLREKYRAAE